MRREESAWNDDGDSVVSRASASQLGSVGSVASRGSAASAGSAGSRDSGTRTRRTGLMLDRASADMQCCTFRLGGQLFGLDVSAVGEVFQVERLVRVPLAPPSVLGLTNLRGAALAVVDLAGVLELAIQRESAPTGIGTALVLEVGGMRVAAAIDHVESVFPVHSQDIRESDALGEHPAIAGFLTVGDDQVVSLLGIDELVDRLQVLRLRKDNDAAAKGCGEGN